MTRPFRQINIRSSCAVFYLRRLTIGTFTAPSNSLAEYVNSAQWHLYIQPIVSSYLQALVACNLSRLYINYNQHRLIRPVPDVSCSYSTTNPFCFISHAYLLHLTYGGSKDTTVVVADSPSILINTSLASVLFCPFQSLNRCYVWLCYYWRRYYTVHA